MRAKTIHYKDCEKTQFNVSFRVFENLLSKTGRNGNPSTLLRVTPSIRTSKEPSTKTFEGKLRIKAKGQIFN